MQNLVIKKLQTLQRTVGILNKKFENINSRWILQKAPNFIELANKIHWRVRINLLSWLWDFNDMFDNNKIEQKFEDLVRDDWQSLREKCTPNKMSFDKIAELYSIWKSCGRKPIFNLQHYRIDSDFWKSIPPNISFKTIQLFSKHHTGDNAGVIENTSLKEFVKFQGKVLDWVFYWQSCGYT